MWMFGHVLYFSHLGYLCLGFCSHLVLDVCDAYGWRNSFRNRVDMFRLGIYGYFILFFYPFYRLLLTFRDDNKQCLEKSKIVTESKLTNFSKFSPNFANFKKFIKFLWDFTKEGSSKMQNFHKIWHDVPTFIKINQKRFAKICRKLPS